MVDRSLLCRTSNSNAFFITYVCQYCTQKEANTGQSIDHISRATFFKILAYMTAFSSSKFAT